MSRVIGTSPPDVKFFVQLGDQVYAQADEIGIIWPIPLTERDEIAKIFIAQMFVTTAHSRLQTDALSLAVFSDGSSRVSGTSDKLPAHP
jgi:hypothetical protein